MEKVFSIMMESFRVASTAAFWALTLSTSPVRFPLAALWAHVTTLRPKGNVGLGHFRRSPISI